jgi:hypothetical protein
MALKTFSRSIEAGYRNVQSLKTFLANDLAPLKGTSEYEEVKQIVEHVEAEQPDAAEKEAV